MTCYIILLFPVSMCYKLTYIRIYRIFISFLEDKINYKEFRDRLESIINVISDYGTCIDDRSILFVMYYLLKLIKNKIITEEFTHSLKSLEQVFMEKIQNENIITFKKNIFSPEITQILRNWFNDNINYPYPSEIEKVDLSYKTGLSLTQIKNWFINARRRILPRKKKFFR